MNLIPCRIWSHERFVDPLTHIMGWICYPTDEQEKACPEIFSTPPHYSNTEIWYERKFQLPIEDISDDDRFCLTKRGMDLKMDVYDRRFVPGKWSVSAHEPLYVFDDAQQTLRWLAARDGSIKRFTVRDPHGNKRKIKIALSLEELV